MGTIRPPEPVKYFCGILMVSETLLPPVVALLEEELGPADSRSETIAFDFTDYYEKEMGPRLARTWISFERPAGPDELPRIKQLTNRIEEETALGGRRRVNLDPGYLTLAKLVLASSKDFSHRLYLSQGIYGEVTLIYKHEKFEALPWTYPDYRSPAGERFFKGIRDRYHRQLKNREP
ncbi:MAG: DUF4416 family protein [Endomicrobiales bacterium]